MSQLVERLAQARREMERLGRERRNQKALEEACRAFEEQGKQVDDLRPGKELEGRLRARVELEERGSVYLVEDRFKSHRIVCVHQPELASSHHERDEEDQIVEKVRAATREPEMHEIVRLKRGSSEQPARLTMRVQQSDLERRRLKRELDRERGGPSLDR